MPIRASIRVLVVEDNAPYREFVLSLVQSSPEFRVIAQAADGAEAVRIAKELRPDVAFQIRQIGSPSRKCS